MTQPDSYAEVIEALAEATSALGLVEAQHGLNPILQRAKDRGKAALGKAPQMWEAVCPTCRQSNRAFLCSDDFHSPLNVKRAASQSDEALVEEVFNAIAHGDEQHRVWLQTELGKLLPTILSREIASARADEREKVLDAVIAFGCPICGGDCGSANPPVLDCPMQALRALKGERT